MLLPSFSFCFDRRRRAGKAVQGSVELRITYNRKNKYLSTGVKVLPHQWRVDKVVNRPDATELNAVLLSLMSAARSAAAALVEAGALDLDRLAVRLKNRGCSYDDDFLSYAAARAKIRCYGLSDGTKEHYRHVLRFLQDWGGITRFTDLTQANIIEMDAVLQAKNIKPVSRFSGYHKYLKAFIRDAIEDGRLQGNPYRRLKLETHDTHSLHKFLTRAEMRKIRTAVMPSKSLERVRDLFVFQTYTCLSYADLVTFDAKKITTDGGRLFYTGKREKTGCDFTFLILRPAAEILQKYDYRLPLISNEKYNAYLKVVAQAAGIDKPVSSHWARHTGATLLLNAGVDMEIVARILGHSSTRVTREVYAKLLDKTIQTEMEKAEKNLSGL